MATYLVCHGAWSAGWAWKKMRPLLASAGLTVDDVTVTPFPDYGQGVAVQQGTVDAATGFANNEPVQLQLAGETVSVLGVPATTRASFAVHTTREDVDRLIEATGEAVAVVLGERA